MDEQVGRLRAFLAEKGLDKDTILFFCSDNGPADPQAKRGIASAGPFRGHKHQMWEGGLRVPALACWPGHLSENKTCSFQTGTVDYLPTILDLLGLPAIENRPMDGISLVPVLKGELSARPVPLAFGYQRLYDGTELYAFIKGKYKICIPEKGDPMMLFDLESDPGETKDLSRTHPELMQQLQAELEGVKSSWCDSREGKDYKW